MLRMKNPGPMPHEESPHLHDGCGLHQVRADLPRQVQRSGGAELNRKLRNARSLLSQHPEIGKVKPGSNGVRVLVIGPYLIEYEVDSDGVLILIVRHGRQDDRPDEDEDIYEE
ncbi:type II toxin-antitoxin system RelE/ParE family toxin [Neorhizobium galegae]|uniref:type II toxin-antitoxin system RelE/ParE family toxin n=1 Tax=Neorhizobium galegae TaxID=399 RepID=UPI000621BEB4|nr:type II toxin-antitoxin system RelE/ParE family toxin [Neorhizobium galegae]CDZ48336.1 Hypothetical protein NGAL_HAMBI2427_26310 [Neorhizobium galegae bv. orientalis]